jgi:hypothetical protein
LARPRARRLQRRSPGGRTSARQASLESGPALEALSRSPGESDTCTPMLRAPRLAWRRNWREPRREGTGAAGGSPVSGRTVFICEAEVLAYQGPGTGAPGAGLPLDEPGQHGTAANPANCGWLGGHPARRAADGGAVYARNVNGAGRVPLLLIDAAACARRRVADGTTRSLRPGMSIRRWARSNEPWYEAMRRHPVSPPRSGHIAWKALGGRSAAVALMWASR